MNCKICRRPSTPIESARVLQKYTVQYYRCSHCGFVQPEEPYWLEEAYASPINASDIGLVGRNVSLAKVTQSVIGAFLKRGGKFLDFGGGYGLFVRLMRDAGLDFYHYDKHCTNIFARGFEVNVEAGQTYELVTAFEVFEHLVEPLKEIDQMLKFSRNILFSTTLMPTDYVKPDDWWYFGLEHGQHVALYSQAALASIARHFSLNLVSDGRQLHLFTESRLSRQAFRLVSNYRMAAIVARLTKRPSLLSRDYQQVTGKPLA